MPWFHPAQVEAVLRASLETLLDALRVEALDHLWVKEKPPTRKVSNLGGQPIPYELGPRRVVHF